MPQVPPILPKGKAARVRGGSPRLLKVTKGVVSALKVSRDGIPPCEQAGVPRGSGGQNVDGSTLSPQRCLPILLGLVFLVLNT